MKNFNTFLQNKILSLILLLFISFTLKSQKIQFIDCNDSIPLNDLLIFSENGKCIDFSNSYGICEIGNSTSKIKIIGLNIKDTVISVKGIKTICLNRLHHNLQEFKIEEENIDTEKLYLEMLQNSWETLQLKDTVCYYNFSYTITIPDSNWTERLNGVIKVEYSQSPKMRFPIVKYCEINHKADSNFLNSSIYKHNRLDGYVSIALDLTYFKRKYIPKYVNKMDDIKLITSEEGIIFLSHSSNDETEQKTYFKNGLIIRNESIRINKNKVLRLVNSYQNTEYTVGSKNKVIAKFYMKKIKKVKETFFVSELEMLLIQKQYQDKDIDFPVGLVTYLKWIELYNEFNKNSN